MSHELRTPLNSLLILAQQLAENPEGNLSPKQVQFADTIHSSGVDLLTLINDILDLSKIESGTTSVDAAEVTFAEVRDAIERTFRVVAEEKGLAFTIALDPSLPRSMVTDGTRLHQVLKNLLSNAFKFTERGSVTVNIGPAASQATGNPPRARRARVPRTRHGAGRQAAEEHKLTPATQRPVPEAVAFAVRDTGIGIPADKQAIIFEPFQQVDMTTSRKFGGTGLGLSISREIAHLLGGELTVQSAPDEGSTFTLYLPLVYQPARRVERSLSRAARSEPQVPSEVAQAPGIRGSATALAEGNTVHDRPAPYPEGTRGRRPRSGLCAQILPWSARGFSSSTTTCAPSSPSPAPWSATAWRWPSPRPVRRGATCWRHGRISMSC
jgi:nitrogen-specific signal transduction histidine kinase